MHHDDSTIADLVQKAELGPHAFERQMPGWLRRQIEAGGMVNTNNQIRADGSLVKVSTIVNETTELVPVLAQLCEQDAGVDRAYLCHPGVRHVSKMKREGGFCGYRNIQMMVSYLRDAKAPGFESFGDGMPNILVLQDMIEEAWDRGFNSAGRIETGGIRGTRKYIGTPEAQALFLSLDIACEAKAYGRGDYGPPYERLLATIEQYFASAGAFGSDKVCRTRLPPVYFQHPGHSMTIVGFERKKSGSSNLLVFDPMFNPSPAISRLLHKTFRQRSSAELLKAYRRGQNYLRKYNAFETLQYVKSPILLRILAMSLTITGSRPPAPAMKERDQAGKVIRGGNPRYVRVSVDGLSFFDLTSS